MLECKDNSGFEDQLTVGLVYTVVTIGENGFKVVNDNEDECWYGDIAFCRGRV
jgi:hypothetical protein